MNSKAKPPFDPQVFLSKVNGGRAVADYRKDKLIYRQGDPADSVFYIQSGKVKKTVISEQGKEAVVALLGPGDFFGEGCLTGQMMTHCRSPRACSRKCWVCKGQPSRMPSGSSNVLV